MAYLTGQVLTQADIAALFTSGTYTPTLANMAIGTGGTPTNTAKFTFVGFPAGGVLTVEGQIKFGTTGVTLPGASNESISLPAGYSMIYSNANSRLASVVQYLDVTGAIAVDGTIGPLTATTVIPYTPTVVGTTLQDVVLSSTAPFTWAVNDEIYYRFSVRCTGP